MKLTFKDWLNETTFVGNGGIRGAGQVTGEGPGPDDEILKYINTNMQDADTRDNQLKRYIKSYHTQFHNDSSKSPKK